ncbi:LysM domain-containing protein [Orenia metallireducens]|jgi:LysM repeat protein|uniref:LysM domain-containing protein n=1 Tax=Orenia metallireducens TaxID=1413210 RepID=A0A285F204_9FIRM|nr:LysM peptidoglycan-binding domain-containing protein [Orenia metallireducens]PRX34718.1 LysM domain-containing protein [Orenia metallireducens]SNY05325.1 LysM domain-containing protein [Orenia metallireducens]
MPTAPLGTFSYIVKGGDTLFAIARRYNTTVSNIVAFNPISKQDTIYPGEVLIIPQSPPEAIIYTIRPGDSLHSIARKYGTQVDTIVEFNYLENPNLIYTGQQLVVPTSLR